MTLEWSDIELHGYLYYSQQGYRILVPPVINKGYDFAIEKNGRFKRVNVKKAWMKPYKTSPSYHISTNLHKLKKYRDLPLPEALKFLKNDCDLFLIWLPDHNKFIETTPDFLVWTNSARCRVPPELFGDPEEQEPFRAPERYELRVLATEGLKRCTLCNKIKPLTEFFKARRRGPKATASYCKWCQNLYARARKKPITRRRGVTYHGRNL
ncbi:hypothetical protein ES703_34439 [subsurface metagenome]